MRVGHASAALTVPVGSALGGYAARPGPATGTLDALEVHAVTVHSGGRRLAWVVLDTPYVHGDLAAAVAALLPGYDVWVSATHTHAGPETSCLPAAQRTPAGWLAEVPPVAAGTVRAAVAAERDARLGLHRQRLAGVGGQRSGPRPRRTVPVDVLRFDGPAGLAGVVVVLPVHPTVLPADNRLVSADLSGAVRRALAGRLGPDAFAVVATGAAGDVSTRPHRRAQTPAECDRLGALVADSVVRALGHPPRATAGGVLSLRRERLALRPKPPTATPDLVRRLAHRLERARAEGDAVATRTAWTALQAAELALTEPARADPTCAVSVARLGGLSLVGLGAEPYLDLGAQLDRLVDHATVLIGYTNGYLGYLPVRAAYRRADYEVLRSPVAAGSAEHVIDRAAALATRTNQEAQ
jgi:neutral ceramidase